MIKQLEGTECWYCEGAKKVWLDKGFTLCPVCNGTGYTNEGVTDENPFPSNDKPTFGVGERITIPEYDTFYVQQLGFYETPENLYFWGNTFSPDVVNEQDLPCVYIELPKQWVREQGFNLLEDFYA